MWNDASKETLEATILSIQSLKQGIDDKVDLQGFVNVIKTKAQNAEAAKIIIEHIAKTLNTSVFLLEFESNKSHEEILQMLTTLETDMRETIEVQIHPDNLPELLYGQREFGCVYIPTELLRELYELGDSVLDLFEGDEKNNVQKACFNVSILAAKWVSFSKRKWGQIPCSELSVVSPLTDENIKNAQPDTEEEAPF